MYLKANVIEKAMREVCKEWEEEKMNKKELTDKELWDTLDTILYPIKRFKGDWEDKYDIHQEIIRKEKEQK